MGCVSHNTYWCPTVCSPLPSCVSIQGLHPSEDTANAVCRGRGEALPSWPAAGVSPARGTRHLYCRINLAVPVLQRFFGQGDTRPDFRLSKESLAVLLDLLQQERRHGWGATIETLVFLFWLASGASYRVVSRVFGIPRSTVHRIVHRVTAEVVAVRHKVICLPKTAEDLAAVTHGFAGLARQAAFGKAAGAIDGCHVRIKPPSGPDGHCYKNRKLFYSIILQAVCDHQGCFIDTYVGWPGSVHDSRVLRHSPLYRRAIYPPPGHFILADGGYPCLQRPLPLITPYKRPVQVTWQPSIKSALQTQLMDDVVDSGGMHLQTMSH
ncbi:putative nuclease HARBI1 [Notolabrus celidotus]|uniref:putative nuclease HARBI1 n=1 Tax=Notolabrus celidotus TaxID=1203425 RepID=UPI00148F92CA|nr:putative nuclease HARBI1 [Notolabrus celidotus]